MDQDARTPSAARRRTAKSRRAVARRAAKGDIAPHLTSDGIAAFSVSEAVTAAQESKAFAITDIIRQTLH